MKTMSKTLASEIARRTMEVVNPQNRAIALSATLRRHGFDASVVPDQVGDQSELIAWLLSTYSGR